MYGGERVGERDDLRGGGELAEAHVCGCAEGVVVDYVGEGGGVCERERAGGGRGCGETVRKVPYVHVVE